MSEAKKQAIYIGVDDDITTVIGNIKTSSADAIAIVPPNRTGILQSAVNLKLLARAARERRKSLVIITSDSALSTLAASAGIPVARNLSSEPKLGEVPEFESKDEVIEGEAAPQVIINKNNTKDKSDSAAVQAVIDDDKIGKGKNKSDQKANKKVPNFNKFRKWIILGAIALVGIIGLCIWLFVFAPHLTINISARTSDEKIDQPIFILKDVETNVDENKINAVIPEPVKKTSEIEFTATGNRLVGGSKASGSATIKCNSPPGLSCDADIVPDTVNGYIIGGKPNTSMPKDSTVTVSLTAPEEGSKYNNAGFTNNSVNYLTITAGQISGGEDKVSESFVQQSDVDAVVERIMSDTESNNMKSDLSGRFNDDVLAIPDSFQINTGAVHSAPAVNEAVGEDKKARVSIEVIYSMFGIKNDDINAVLMASAVNKLKGKDDQGVFDNGFSNVQILSYQNTDNGGSARLVTTAKIGPAINDEKLKQDALGKKKNEIKEELEKIGGVQNVEVNFFPFWVSQINDENKITIEKSGF